MSVPAAYLGIIVIWSTTPLAIQWSGEGLGFLPAVTGRMVLGALVSLMLLGLFSIPLPWHRQARRVYLVAGAGIFAAMYLTYWSAGFIPSGWIALLFGLAPMITGVFASLLLRERVSAAGIAGIALGFAGLASIVAGGHALGPDSVYGIAGMLAAVTVHSASAVVVKRMGSVVSSMAMTTGGLLVASALFLAALLTSPEPLPARFPARALWSMIYLGLFGSILGFTLYFYVLRHMEATRVALIALITPVVALLLGNTLNGEPIPGEVLWGGGILLAGLLIYQYGDRIRSRSVADAAGEQGTL